MRSKFSKNALYVIVGFTFFASVVTVFFDHWMAQLWVHFILQYTFLFFILLLITLRYHARSFLTLIVAIGLLINVFKIIPFYFSKASDGFDHEENFTIMSINLWSQNKSVASVKYLLKKQDTDIIILLEYTHEWHKQLKEEMRNYPYHKMCVRSDNFGMAVFSKIAMETELEINDVPQINAIVQTVNPFHLLIRHPRPPLNSVTYQAQKRMFNELEDFENNTTKPVVIAGDLNSSSFSYSFNKLTNNTSLIDTRNGFGLQATWPSQLGHLGITLDHFLINNELIVIDRKVLHDIGSDHLPVLLKFTNKKTASVSQEAV